MKTRVGIVGASGYSGMVAARLLAAHPHVELAFVTSDKWTGKEAVAGLRYIPNADALAASEGVPHVMLATSAEVSLDLAPKLLARGVSVIDFSGAFRLHEASAYPRWYGFEHHAPNLLKEAFYGLPEIAGSPPKTGLIANPGCYPTATILALAPLVRAGLIEAEGIVVDAKSGVTGAGRQSKEAYSFGEVDGDFRAYRILKHQHTPEIVQTCGVRSLTFTAHLLPVRRGILATCYAKPKGSEQQIRGALEAAYAKARFVKIVDPEAVTLASVVGTNECHLGIAMNEDVLIVVSAIDNLVKGAAGQAVQNLNLRLGLDEGVALDSLTPWSP
ncbi:MAG: N-acetyl-gamma-glutamyl-phosphate reductase [Polyangiales bacterium]